MSASCSVVSWFRELQLAQRELELRGRHGLPSALKPHVRVGRRSNLESDIKVDVAFAQVEEEFVSEKVLVMSYVDGVRPRIRQNGSEPSPVRMKHIADRVRV